MGYGGAASFIRSANYSPCSRLTLLIPRVMSASESFEQLYGLLMRLMSDS
jgi:hypothetical protein